MARRARTLCLKGLHELTEANVYHAPRGYRLCLACRREARRAKRKANAFARQRGDRTHCVHGHPLSGDNLRPDRTKRRASLRPASGRPPGSMLPLPPPLTQKWFRCNFQLQTQLGSQKYIHTTGVSA